jgi:hypothetical protein
VIAIVPTENTVIADNAVAMILVLIVVFLIVLFPSCFLYFVESFTLVWLSFDCNVMIALLSEVFNFQSCPDVFTFGHSGADLFNFEQKALLL